ncbi:MAG TPA: RDD family protein [Pyrinomonadaceae bacterium]|jgi:uncharacterized RDD family membrane protein YckC
MNSIRCPQCGLVNWASAEACKRCRVALQASYEYAAQAAMPVPTAPIGFQPPAVYNPYPSYADYWPGPAGYDTNPLELASRSSRFVASLIDDVCIIAVIIVSLLLLFIASSASGGQGQRDDTPFILFFVVMMLGILAIAIVQLYFLCKDGQTIGKKLLNIRIVKVETGENGGFTTNALMRGIVPNLIGSVPYIGPLFHLVDALFIFREDHRCIHDHLAGTCVIKKQPGFKPLLS